MTQYAEKSTSLFGKRILLSLILPSLGMAILLLSTQVASPQVCPPCYTDNTIPTGHGVAPDGSGRRLLKIYIDASWNTSSGTTNTQIWNAVNDAASNWNNATDSYGNHTGYYFQVSQGGGASQADIVISNGGNISGATAEGTPWLSQDTIDLDSTLSGSNGVISELSASATVAHEFGHFIGLGDCPSEGICGSTNTIMREANGEGVSYVTTISHSDVAQSNVHLMTRSNCQEPMSTDQGGETEDSGQGQGGGSPPPQYPTCNSGMGANCSNCIPPQCAPPQGWNPQLCSCYGYPSPIVIDTDGSGFHLTSAEDGVLFDFFGDGKPIQISWTAVGSSNGWLALDRNNNGVIDSARELFGDVTVQPQSNDPNGFLALAVFDAPENGGNDDGVIDSRDGIWPKLLVWIDSNHDGISQPEELHHLDDLGIHSIDLKYHMAPLTDQYGNKFRYRGKLNTDRGELVNRVIYDVILTTTDGQQSIDKFIQTVGRPSFASLFSK